MYPVQPGVLASIEARKSSGAPVAWRPARNAGQTAHAAFPLHPARPGARCSAGSRCCGWHGPGKTPPGRKPAQLVLVLVGADRLADRHAIQPPDQATIDPGFDTVCVAGLVQCCVGVLHLRQDPGATAGRALARVVGAMADHGLEGRVDADLAPWFAPEAAQRLAQRRVQPEIGHLQYHARVDAPPQDGLALAEPRKDALPVGRQQRRHVELPAGGEQARHAGCRIHRPLNRRECGAGLEPGNGGLL